VHQTKVRLTAAAIDAVENSRGGGQVQLGRVDAKLIQDGLELCIARHAEAWRALCPQELLPSFACAFELIAPEPAKPAFMQCPQPAGLTPVAEARGLKLLPDFGFAVPSLVPADGPMQRACQLMAFAGKQFYVKGQPTGSRPLSQAVAIDVPGWPAWRFRHEVETCLGMIVFGREQLGFRGGIVFAWLLPFIPGGRPIPRELQHPCLLDVGSPLRLRPDGRIAVYSRTCRIGGSDMQLGNAALGPRDVWPAAGLPGIRITTGGAHKRGAKAKAGKAAALQTAGLEAKPIFVQRPFNRVPSGAEIVGLIGATRLGGGNGGLGVPALDIYRREEGFELPEGAELVVEGEPIGATSTTATWLDIRIPLPDPAAGAETIRSRWVRWQGAAERQVQERARRGELLRGMLYGAFLRRHQVGERQPGKRAKEKAGVFARRWHEALETGTTLRLTIAHGRRRWTVPRRVPLELPSTPSAGLVIRLRCSLPPRVASCG
jgi:hypothetical protein